MKPTDRYASLDKFQRKTPVGFRLDQFRLLVKTGAVSGEPHLLDDGDGFVLRFEVLGRGEFAPRSPGVLIAEKSGEPRRFARLETVLRLLWDLKFPAARIENHRSSE